MGAGVYRGEVGECALKKNSDGASLPEERACLDCLISKKLAEVGLQGGWSNYPPCPIAAPDLAACDEEETAPGRATCGHGC
jgi:hypothetical protein